MKIQIQLKSIEGCPILAKKNYNKIIDEIEKIRTIKIY